MSIHPQTINEIKAAGHFFAAGALARSLGHPRYYGCHFGMRSDLENARNEFYRGWDAKG